MLKKNCNNCRHLDWGFGDIGDPEGWACLKRDYYKHGNSYKEENKHLKQLSKKDYREKAKMCCDLRLEDEKGRFCYDKNGEKIRAGDKVKYWSWIHPNLKDLEGDWKIGEVWCIGDMNEKQINMPYIRGKGAWTSIAIEKYEEGCLESEV